MENLVWRNNVTALNEANMNRLFEKVIVVTETGTNLNDYVYDGIYFFGTTAVRPTNSPNNTYGWLQVLSNANHTIVKQIWHRSASINNSNEHQTFVRLLNGGTWSDWKQFQMVEVDDFKSNVTFAETAPTGNCRFIKIGKMVFIEYQGESKAHASGDLIFTVPSGYEPAAGNVPVQFVKNANAFGTVQLNKADRKCSIAAISDATVTGRIYFSMFYNVE